MQKKQNKNCQSGRSMVEMLGVLAVVGILAVSGILGYQYAMRLYRVAETYDEVSVTVSGSRTWPILEHYGPLTKIGVETLAPAPHADTFAYIVPIREVVSKVNYRKAITAAEALNAGVSNSEYLDDKIESSEEASESYYARREYESFTSRTFAPVWVRAETPDAWSVRVTGLSYDMCASLVSKRELGYQYAYVALNNGGVPVDPNFWDFPLVTSYSNSDIADHDNLKKLCEEVDPKHRAVPPAYTFQKDINRLNAENSNITSVGGCSVEDGVPSVRCMAFNARVDDLPLQTLVLYWGPKTDEDPEPPVNCQPGTCYNFDDEPTEYCCENEANGLWIDDAGICCALGENLATPSRVKIAGQYYVITRQLTGRDTDGNRQEICDNLPPPNNYCIKGTPWFQGDASLVGGAGTGDCPAGPAGSTVPDMDEHQLCCQTQAGGVWTLKPGNPANIALPLSSNPKSSDRTRGGALCCWSGRGNALSFDTSNPMSCEAPNIWSKRPPTQISTLVPHRLKNTGKLCTGQTPGGGGSTTPDDDGETPTCPSGYRYSDAADSVGSSPGVGCIQQYTAMGYYWCCPGEPDTDVDNPDLNGDNAGGSDFNDDDTGGDGSDFNDDDGSSFNDSDICMIAEPLPPLDIYGQENTDCCKTEKKNGFWQITPYVSSSKVSQTCCEAMNLPGRTTPQRSGMTTVYGQGSGNRCSSECCDGQAIQDGMAGFQANQTNSRYRSNIFLNAKGVSNPEMCCQLLDGEKSSKFQHPECCEANLAYDISDEVGRWVDKNTGPLQITVLDADSGECRTDIVYNPDNTCCKPGENGLDIECKPNLFCCGTDLEENKKSETCCPLVPGHYWDSTTNECTPCGPVPDGDCGSYCEDIDGHCCIKDINGCFEPYAWDKNANSVYIEKSCCHECIKNPSKASSFIGFSKPAKEKGDKIIGDCYRGFSMSSSSGN